METGVVEDVLIKKIEWRIDDFFALPIDGTPSVSPTFLFESECWFLAVLPNGKTLHDSVGHIGLYLFRTESGPPIHLSVSFSFKTLDGKRDEKRFANVKCKFRGWGCHKFMARSTLLERRAQLMPSDTLIIVCTITHDSETPKNTASSTDEVKSEVLSYESGGNCTPGTSSIPNDIKLLNDFKELFLKNEDCDVVIKVQGKEFQVHRIILRARSPVLASTFRSNMKEQETGVINIEDCDPSSFSDFLCFLYCGEVKNLSTENVSGLFYTADKYDVQDLRAICVDFLKKNLNVDTFCETISLALRHSERELVELATDFFIKNAPNIILTVQWQSFLAENPTESNELLVKLLVPKPNTSNLSK